MSDLRTLATAARRASLLRTAGACLTVLRSSLDSTIVDLSRVCAMDEYDFSVSVERRQIPTFELAWAAADVLAAESPVSRYFVDARVLSIFEGAEETLALKVIARGLLDHALEGRGQAA